MNADNGCARTFTISFVVVVVAVTLDKAVRLNLNFLEGEKKLKQTLCALPLHPTSGLEFTTDINIYYTKGVYIIDASKY